MDKTLLSRAGLHAAHQSCFAFLHEMHWVLNAHTRKTRHVCSCAPVQCQAVAVAQAAEAAQAVPLPMEGGADAKVAGHAIHVLLVLGQHLLRWRVPCTQPSSSPSVERCDVLIRLC